MKLRMGILLGAGFLLLIPRAWADSPRVGSLNQAITGTFETTVVSGDVNGTLVSSMANTVLYGFSVVVTTANGWCALYDASAITGIATTQGVFIDEASSPTAVTTIQSLWPAPYRLVNGLVVQCVAAKAILYHDVK